MKKLSFSLGTRKFAALAWGDENRPLIVALHGWLDNAASFVPLAAQLTDYYVIAIDLAGHGESSHRSADAHYHLVDYVHDLHALFSQQNWQQVRLIGHSLGGIIASMYAASFNERIQSLVLIESMGPLTEPETSSAQQLRDSIVSRIAAADKQPQHPKTLAQAVTARKIAGDMHQQNAQRLVERNLKEEDGQLMWRSDPRLRTISSLRLTEQQAQGLLTNITCPTLVVVGEQGFEKVKKNVEKRAAWIENLELVTCQGGHHLHMDYPLQTAQAILTFLQQTK